MPDITLCADSYDCPRKRECRRALLHYEGGYLKWQTMSALWQRWKHEKTQECEYYEPVHSDE